MSIYSRYVESKRYYLLIKQISYWNNSQNVIEIDYSHHSWRMGWHLREMQP